MDAQIFRNIGLNKAQSDILNVLFARGEMKANTIALELNRSRGIVYKELDELLGLRLIEKKDKKGQIARFRAIHPRKFAEFFKNKEAALKKEKNNFFINLPDLISRYNLSSKKPTIKFYEDIEGLKEVIFDTLTSETEVYTFSDSHAMRSNPDLKQINEKYVRLRNEKGLKKKLIIPSTAKKYFTEYNQELVQIKLLKKEYYPFNSSVQIYDNKVSFQTTTKDKLVAVLIEDENIYKLHKLLFESIWNSEHVYPI